jgi:hypothetical protein
MVAHDDRLMAQLFIRLDRDRTRRERVLFGKARVQFSVGSICINSLSYLLVSRHQPGTLAPVGDHARQNCADNRAGNRCWPRGELLGRREKDNSIQRVISDANPNGIKAVISPMLPYCDNVSTIG